MLGKALAGKLGGRREGKERLLRLSFEPEAR